MPPHNTPPSPPLAIPAEVLRHLAESRTPRGDLFAIALVQGVAIHPDATNQAQAAAVLGITRAAMSKRVRLWADRLGIDGHTLRPAATRERCRKAQLRGHWRRRKVAPNAS